ncbi:MAG: Rpn family recombination-promoting nuclease/putative transposase, partial [Chloroflexota bacterium]
ESWVAQVDKASLERVNKTFVSPSYDKRESDLIYRVRLKDQDIYIIILTEFQSKVDRLMGLRFAHYILLYYMDYVNDIKELDKEDRERGFKLPVVFPILLYNGSDNWSAPTDLAGLIEEHPNLGEYRPRFKYFPIAQNSYSKQELLDIGNIVSTIFLAETNFDVDVLKDELLALYQREPDKTAMSILLNWFRQLWVHGRISEEEYGKLDEVYHSTQEVETMLEVAAAKQKQAILEQGKEIGRIEQSRKHLLRVLSSFYKLPEQELTIIQEELEQVDSEYTLAELINLCLDGGGYEAFRASLDEILDESSS